MYKKNKDSLEQFSRYNDGYMYVNTDGATKWERLAMTSQIPNIETKGINIESLN